jgi:hypothetical protein
VTLITSGLSDYAASTSRIETKAQERPLQELAELWEDYVDAENILGLSDLNRMNRLRSKRDKARSLLADVTRSKISKERERSSTSSLFDSPRDITDRYDALCCSLPQADGDLTDRSRGKDLVEEIQKQETAQLIALRDVGKKGSKKDVGGSGQTTDTPNLLGVPPILREFLSKLPTQYVGPIPDIQGFIRHLKNMVLPPRPASDDRDGHDSSAAPSWLSATVQYENGDDDNDDDDDNDGIIRDDIFRKRQRARLGI